MNSVLLSKVSSFLRPPLSQNIINYNIIRCLNVTSIDLARRKGTREKARKNKVKVEVKKVEYLPRKVYLEKKRRMGIDLHRDIIREDPVDDVYVMRTVKVKVYSFLEAIKCFRESNHPQIFNAPNAPINARIELNMQGEKKTRIKEDFTRTVLIPHPFFVNDKTILVLCKDQNIHNLAREAGATHAGGLDVIKQIQTGELRHNEFEYIIAHPDILPDILPIRGILKKKFPNDLTNTISKDVLQLLSKFRSSILIESHKDEFQQNFAQIKTCFGKINTEPEHLEENLSVILNSINAIRPKRAGPFVTRVYLESPPCNEILRIDPFIYIPKEKVITTPTNVRKTETAPEEVKEEGDEDSDDEEVKKANA